MKKLSISKLVDTVIRERKAKGLYYYATISHITSISTYSNNI